MKENTYVNLKKQDTKLHKHLYDTINNVFQMEEYIPKFTEIYYQ